MFSVEFHESAEAFFDANEELLLKNETFHSLILGLCSNIIAGLIIPDDPLYLSIKNGSKIVGQAFRTNRDKPLALGLMEEQGVVAVAQKIKEMNIDIQGVVGKNQLVQTFCSHYKEAKKTSMHQGVYELNQVIFPHNIRGRMREYREQDEKVSIEFSVGFINDCFPNETNPQKAGKENILRYAKYGKVYLWEDENHNVVSMAIISRETKNAATISYVYTPNDQRGKGYASMLVACLSQKILDDGKKYANLFTDLTNPTSNSIYKKIGYKMIAQSLHIEF